MSIVTIWSVFLNPVTYAKGNLGVDKIAKFDEEKAIC